MAKNKSSANQAGPDASLLSSSEINDIIEVCLAAPMDGYPGQHDCLWGLPLLIEGKPGIAKTARIKQIARGMGADLEALFAAQHPPEDFSGALIPTGNGSANQICPLPQVRKLINSGSGILFLDEINGAPPATQGALMSLIHERRAGDASIPPRVRILAAQNPEELATGGYRMAPALANRFVHVRDPGPNAREWIAWLTGSSNKTEQAPLDAIEKAVVSDWPDLYPEAQALFAGFMETSPALLHNLPQISDPNSGRAWPSHRTWDYAMRAWTTARILEKPDAIQHALVEACVGPGAAETFLAYQSNVKIPKPTEVLDGKYTIDTDRLDVVLAAYTGMVAYVRQRPTREEKVKLAPKAWECMEQLLTAKLNDLVIPAMTLLVHEKLGHNSGDDVIKKAANKILVPMAKSGLAKYIEEKV